MDFHANARNDSLNYSEADKKTEAKIDNLVDEILKIKIENLVDEILKIKSENSNGDVSEIEGEIDGVVYTLYDLTEEEINIIERKN